jgi:hypothetical protein
MLPNVPAYRRPSPQVQAESREEARCTYQSVDLIGDFEFKILRCLVKAFHRRPYLDRILSQEAAAGWELIEAFDAKRLRLKRPEARRALDGALPPGCDPYRFEVGPTKWQIASWVTSVIAATKGLFFLSLYAMNRAGWIAFGPSANATPTLLTFGILGLVASVVLCLIAGRPRW